MSTEKVVNILYDLQKMYYSLAVDSLNIQKE